MTAKTTKLPKPDRPNIWGGSYSPQALRQHEAAVRAALIRATAAGVPDGQA